MINKLNGGFLEFFSSGENKFIDESMIPYDGTHGRTKRINSRPIQAGYKICVLAKAYGCLARFKPYKGVKKGQQVASSTKWGLGENIVL